jgi:ElaB/YqjD/DUF883 family membrane-anchored ribosome-binding protein
MMNISRELQRLTDHADGLLDRVADYGSPQVPELRTRVNQSLDALKHAAGSADDYVRENPWVAIGVIAGVAASLGFLAGYMVAPRKSFMGMIRR